jgi:hypothetical protein
MKGYHYAGVGGEVRHPGEQVFAELLLSPGKYIVFANVECAIGSSSGANGAYTVRLKIEGAIKNEWIGGLQYDLNDPGSRNESIALSAAVDEEEGPFPVTLVVQNALYSGAMYAWNPRLSAIQLDDLEVVEGDKDRSDSERQALESQLIAGSAHSGVPIDAIIKILGR